MTLFKYKSGANPYIAKTQEEKEKLIAKYNGRISKNNNSMIESYTIDDVENDKIFKMYNNIENLRQKIKNNSKCMNYYNYLKDINKNDALYGWMFENDAILNDTLEELDLYNENYQHDLLECYYGELESILSKGVE